MWIVNEDIFGHTTISPKQARTYLDKKSFTKQWLAEISGIDIKFGFKREFVKNSRFDYRPDFWENQYKLSSGKIYQYNNFYVALGQYVSGYFAVSENGENILTLEKDEVRKLLGMPVKNWIPVKKEIPIFKNEEYCSDDVPF